MPVQVSIDFGRTRRTADRATLTLRVLPESSVEHMSGAEQQSQGVPASSAHVSLNHLLPKGATSLPAFTGRPDTRAYAAPFLDRVKRVLALQPELTEQHKLVAIQNCFPLDSPAGSWYLLRLPDFATFNDFELAFVSRFGASDIDTSYLRRQFRRFRQNDNDNVTKYHAALLDLASRISLNGTRLAESEITDQFMIGLKPALSDLVFHEQIRAGRDYSLDELVKIAEDIERTEQRKARAARNAPTVNAVNAPAAKTGKYCAYHKTTSHSTDECSVVQRLKRENKWRGKPAEKQ